MLMYEEQKNLIQALCALTQAAWERAGACQALQDVAASEGHTDPALEQRIAVLRCKERSIIVTLRHTHRLRQRLVEEEDNGDAADCWP